MNSEKKSGQTKTAVILLTALVILAVGFLIVYNTLIKKPAGGEKTITVRIEHLNTEPRTVIIETDAGYLMDALTDGGIAFEGEDSYLGFYITSFDGYTPNGAEEEWWGYTKSGEYVETAIDQTVIADGDEFEFTLNVGYNF